MAATDDACLVAYLNNKRISQCEHSIAKDPERDAGTVIAWESASRKQVEIEKRKEKNEAETDDTSTCNT